MKFMQDTKENVHAEMLAVWMFIGWIWRDSRPDENVISVGMSVFILVLMFRHVVLMSKLLTSRRFRS